MSRKKGKPVRVNHFRKLELNYVALILLNVFASKGQKYCLTGISSIAAAILLRCGSENISREDATDFFAELRTLASLRAY